jgi:hypothetical protein
LGVGSKSCAGNEKRTEAMSATPMNLREREELAHDALNTKFACCCQMFLETQKSGLGALQHSGEY